MNPVADLRRALRVLVVDDNRDAADSLAVLLEMWGHEAHAAYDGPSALEAARALAPDAVVLDLAMPGMTGWEVAQRLRALPGFGEALILAHSAHGREEHVVQSIEAGFDRHLAKPHDGRELRALLADRRAALVRAGLLAGGLAPGGGQ